METSFLKMVDQTRLSNYLGLKMAESFAYSRPSQPNRGYAYIEIPALALVNTADGSVDNKALRNQYIKVRPACTVNVRGSYRFEVHPNPQLFEYGIAQGMYYIEPESGEMIPDIYIQLRKDLDLDSLDYAIRIYMRA
jgi:hypothetical protein